MELNKENILKVLSNVMEPEKKKDIVSLEMIKDIEVQDGKLSFTLYVLNPAMHSRKRMEDACRFAIERNFGKDLQVDIDVKVLSKEHQSASQRKILPGVKNIIAVKEASGDMEQIMTIINNKPDGFEVISSFRVKEGSGPHWARPSIYKGMLLVRHGDVLISYKISS